MYMFLVDDFRSEAYISLAYGEFFPLHFSPLILDQPGGLVKLVLRGF
jgi:hypothetical protein